MRRIRRLIALRPGEGRPVGLLVSLAFVVAGGLMVGQSSIEALFFARYGVDRLPVMYLVLGVVMFGVTSGFGPVVARVGPARASIAIPAVMAVLVVAGRGALAADVSWITQGLWLLQGAGYFVLGLAVWGVAGVVTDTRQAKRFFPLLGAGTVVGSVAGGLATRPLAAWIGTANLLFVWLATLVAAVILAAAVLADRRRERRPTRRHPRRASEALTEGFRSVAGSPLMRWLALASVLFSLLFFSLYLPFSRAATARYPDPAELAGFFGQFFGIAAGVAFFLSLFVTNRLLARFGVPAVALVLPVLYVVAFAGLVVEAGFALLAVARFAQVAWMQGGATSAWEAVINTVPPDRRDQTRAFLYGGPTQVGTILAGAVALVGERAFSPRLLFGIGLAAAVIATVAMFGVRRWYPRELVRALREGRPSVFGATAAGAAALADVRADASAVGVAIEGLHDGDVRVRRVAAAVLGDVGARSALGPLRDALEDPDAEVRAAAVRSIGELDVARAAVEIVGRTADAEPIVRRAVVDVVGRAPRDPEAIDAVRRLLADPDHTVRCRAAALLAWLGDGTAIEVLTELAVSTDAVTRSEAHLAIAWSADGREAAGAASLAFARLAHDGLSDEVPAVRAAAARALGSLGGIPALDALVGATADPSPLVREAVADACAAVGAAAVEPLLVALEDAGRREGVLSALERLPVDGGAETIRRVAATCVAGAVMRHRAGAAIEQGRDDRLDLLRDSLRFRADREARTALRAAALLGAHVEINVALENLADGDGLRRANALEVIESVVERPLVRPLLAIWDETPEPSDAAPLVARLTEDPDDWIRACAVLAATATRGGPMETLTTLSPMERVLFLRKVPLFAELPPPDLLPVATVAREVAFDDGETIAEQGELGEEMHVIVDGEVSVVVRETGAVRVLATRSVGDAVGEMSLLTSEPRIAGLVARGSVRALSIDRPGFESILRERPETALGVIRVLCHRLTEARPGAQADATDAGESATAST